MARDKFTVNRLPRNGVGSATSSEDADFGLFEIKRSMTTPVSVFGSRDALLVHRICGMLNALTE